MDPITGSIYGEAQIQYSIKENLKKSNKSEGDDEEEKTGDSFENNKEAEDEELSDAEEESDDDEVEKENLGDGEQRARKPKLQQTIPFSINKWDLIPQDILARLVSILSNYDCEPCPHNPIRLIRRPEDSPEKVDESLRRFQTFENRYQQYRTKCFDQLRIIDIDASQTPGVVHLALMEQLSTLGFLSTYKNILPERIAPPSENGFRGQVEINILKYLYTQDVLPGVPKRNLSYWGRHCPVTWYDESSLVLGQFTSAAAFKVRRNPLGQASVVNNN